MHASARVRSSNPHPRPWRMRTRSKSQLAGPRYSVANQYDAQSAGGLLQLQPRSSTVLSISPCAREEEGRRRRNFGSKHPPSSSFFPLLPSWEISWNTRRSKLCFSGAPCSFTVCTLSLAMLCLDRDRTSCKTHVGKTSWATRTYLCYDTTTKVKKHWQVSCLRMETPFAAYERGGNVMPMPSPRTSTRINCLTRSAANDGAGNSLCSLALK